ncbi:MAG: tripartite tricarboxylate transporter substrate binding protein [Hyphomicrobiales bacterium]|nr:tripartite tricarboxylate transporter substrate binding protein [Hyphomicrobiales bacterium]
MHRVILVISFFLAWGSDGAHAQSDYPNRPVKVVVPFGAGGAPDVLARLLSQELSARLNQQFVVENVTGAGGSIGAAHAAKSAPDGYTLIFTSEAPLVINPHIYQKLGYDPVTDFAPITQLVRTIFYVVACPKLPVNTLNELADYGRKQQMSYASSGFGTTMNLSGELLKQKLKFDMTHVPYKAVPAAMTDIVACNIDVGFAAFNTGYPLISTKQLKGLAVSSETRRPETPEIPTLRELGLQEMEAVESSYNLLAPAKVPSAIIQRLHAEVLKIMHTESMRKNIAGRGMLLKTNGSPEEFAAWLAEARIAYKKIIAAARIGIK